ncbi:hypothetical protein ACWCOV_08405 [Kribbella sp. NPDC002412]
MELMPPPDAEVAGRTLDYLADSAVLLVHRVAGSLPVDPVAWELEAAAEVLDREAPPDQAVLAILAVPDEILREVLHAELQHLGALLSGREPDRPLPQITALVEARLSQLTAAASRK